MSEATSYSLRTTPSTIQKRLKFLESLTTQPTDINKMVEAAHVKLSPVIEYIVKNSRNNNSNFITKEQFEDAIIASKIIRDVDSILKLDTVELVNILKCDLENANVSVNRQGLIFVDTALLLQLIDLHSLLEEYIEYIDPPESEATDCLIQTDIQTDSCLTFDNSNAPKLNKFTIKMKRPKDHFGENMDWPALTDFILLPTLQDLEDDRESRLFIPHIQKARSVGFLTEEETTDITNVVGARDIIEKCICDLERVQCFMTKGFKKPVSDSFTDTKTERLEEQKYEERRKSSLNRPQSDRSNDDCCCSDSCGKINLDKEDGGVCGEDNVVICIKGRSPEEGDVQIVIKQCPDCRNVCAPCPSKSQTDRGVSPDRDLLMDKDTFPDRRAEEPKLSIPQPVQRRPTPPSPPPPPPPSPQPVLTEEKIKPERKMQLETVMQREEEMQPEEEIQQLEDVDQQASIEEFKPNIQLKETTSLSGSQASSKRSSQKSTGQASPVSFKIPDGTEASSKRPSQKSDGQASLDSSTDHTEAFSKRLSQKSNDQASLVSSKSSDRTEASSNGLSQKSTDEASPAIPKIPGLTEADKSPEKDANQPLPEQQESEVDILQKLSDLDVVLPPVPPPDKPQTPTEELKTEKPLPVVHPQQQQFRSEMDCTNMQMYEAKKLCLSTEQGEELLITLTVTPNHLKNQDNRELFLVNLFSEDDSSASNPVKQSRLSQSSPKAIDPKENSPSQKHNSKRISASKEASPVDLDLDNELNEDIETQVSYSVFKNEKDRVIPLERTKVCSSIEFDVKLVDTKIRKKGIKTNNKSILVQLNDLGVDNLLRASRPAKCCRKAVLNEKMKKYLPYPPSLKSLPLDEEDLNVINQSLQMSLQKVKNSTDLRNNYQEQQNYCLNKFKVMYSLVDKSNKNYYFDRCPDKNMLSYYINLVNDKRGEGPLLQYDVMYFEVEETIKDISKNQVNTNTRSKTNFSGRSRLNEVNVNVLEIVSGPVNFIKDKYRYREERPLIGGTSFATNVTNQSKQNLPKIFTEVCSTKTDDKPVTPKQQKTGSKKKINSKIPVLQLKLLKLCKIDDQKTTIDEMEILEENSEKIYSETDSLSVKSPNLKGAHTNQLRSLKIPSHESVADYIQALLSEDSRSSLLLSKRNSRNIIPRGRRKKHEFRCSRSKSDISLNDLSQRSSKNNNKQVHVNKLSVTKVSRASSAIQSWSKMNDERNKDVQNLAELVLKYLSDVLYEMLPKEMVREKKTFGIRSQKSLVLTKKSIKNIHDLLKNTRTTKCHKKIECRMIQDLKSISSDKCFDDVEHSLPIQTSVASQLETLNQECQTVSMANFVKQKEKKEPVPKVFGKFYNKEALMGIPNSCDEMENFIVVFKSENSFKGTIPKINESNKISTTDVISTPSSTLDPSTGESTIRFKDFEKIVTTKTTHVAMNPVEYMVYQNYVKPSSFLQKLITKTKDILNSGGTESGDNDIKYCRICKCEKSRCLLHTNQNEKPDGCKCPDENKKLKRKKINVKKPKAKSKPGKSWCNLARIKSIPSFREFRTRIKTSITNILKRSKGQYVDMCSSSKPCKNAETMACSLDCDKFKENQTQYDYEMDPNKNIPKSLRKNQKPKNTETSTRRLELNNNIKKVDQSANAVLDPKTEQDSKIKESKTKSLNETKRLSWENEKTTLFEKGSISINNEELIIANNKDQSEINKEISEIIQGIEINLDECSCENACEENTVTCCCETCPGCSENADTCRNDGQDFVMNYLAAENVPKFIIASAKADDFRFLNIGLTRQPLYSVVLPHNLFDININNLGHNNPFQNALFVPPQEQLFWELPAGLSTNTYKNGAV